MDCSRSTTPSGLRVRVLVTYGRLLERRRVVVDVAQDDGRGAGVEQPARCAPHVLDFHCDQVLIFGLEKSKATRLKRVMRTSEERR